MDEVTKSQDPSHTGGRKFDGDKIRFDLLPHRALVKTMEVLMLGAKKYEPNNWMRVPDSERRYYNAAMRHMMAWKMGEESDPETGIHHLAHAICCMMFIVEKDSYSEEEWNSIKDIKE